MPMFGSDFAVTEFVHEEVRVFGKGAVVRTYSVFGKGAVVRTYSAFGNGAVVRTYSRKR